MRKKVIEEGIKVHGFYHIQLVNLDGSIAGEAKGHNLIVNSGFRYYMAYALGAIAGSLQVTHMALGTGGAVDATSTSIANEVAKRQAVTAASSSTSKAVRFTATFDSANSFLAGTSNISNIGLYNSSSTGTLFAGTTFASSSCATNQTVNCTYDISWT